MAIKFNAGQKKAFEAVKNWLLNSHEIFYILGGYAGVGKTTMAMEMARDLKQRGFKVQFAAPTNKAKDVIAGKLEAANVDVDGLGTVHQLVYTPNEDGGFDFNPDKMVRDGILICDECSMLTEAMMQDLQMAARMKDTRVILMGDDFQLPAVETDNKEHPTPFQTVPQNCQVTLTQVMRQAGGSKVLEYATALRASGRAAVPAQEAADVRIASVAAMKQQYVADLKAGVDATMLAAANKTRVTLNKQIRAMLYGADANSRFFGGEAVIGIANAGELSNGTLTHLPQQFTVLFDGTMRLGSPWMHRNGRAKDERVVLIAGSDGTHWAMVPETEQASIQPGWFAADRLPHDWVTADDFGKLSLAADVKVVTMAYVITGHKSQGSQWAKVYIANAWTWGEDLVMQARWLYTAVTRAAKELVLSDAICLPKATWQQIGQVAAPFLDDEAAVEAPAQPTPVAELVQQQPAPTPAPAQPKKVMASDVMAFKSTFFSVPVSQPQQPKPEVKTEQAAVVRQPKKAEMPKVKVEATENLRPVTAVKADERPRNSSHPEFRVPEEMVPFVLKMLGIRK